jgi:hypothetical protein
LVPRPDDSSFNDVVPRPAVGADRHDGAMTAAPTSGDVAAAYFDAWRSNDIEGVRPLLHPDVDFAGSLGATQGIEDTLAGLGGMFAMTERVEVVRRWVDGPDVLTWFELRTATAGPLAIVNWSHVESGRITRIRVTFDPRSLLA